MFQHSNIMVEMATSLVDEPSLLRSPSIPSMVEVENVVVVKGSTVHSDQTEHIEVGVSTVKRFNFLVVGAAGSGTLLSLKSFHSHSIFVCFGIHFNLLLFDIFPSRAFIVR